MNADLIGQVAVVIGGTHGLGRAIATALARCGAQVVTAARSEQESRDTATALQESHGTMCLGVRCDVTSETDVDALFSATTAEFGRVDMLVNSAGMHIRGPAEDVSRAEFDRSLAVNVTGTWLTCRAAAAMMKPAGYGRILNMASALGLVGAANRSSYAAAKGAVAALTRALAVEWARTGITVNALAPGPFDTRMNVEVVGDPRARAGVPMGRWGAPEEVQALAVHLLSPAASYMTGAIVSVDGGVTAQ